MKTLRLPTLFVGLALFVPVTLVAQNGDLLVIERKADCAGRDLLLRRLNKVRITLSFNEASAEEVAQYLTVAAGKGIAFIVSSRTVKPSELPTLTLTVKSLSLANAMAVISTQTGLRRQKFHFQVLAVLISYTVMLATACIAKLLSSPYGQ